MEIKNIKNKAEREIPEYIKGYGEVKPYAGPFATEPTGRKYAPLKSFSKPGDSKILASIKEAVEKCEIKDGMTISSITILST